MLGASAFVINHRVRRIAAAGNRPDASDQREFQRMGLEKIEAAWESAGAVGLRMMMLLPQAGMQMMQYWMKLSAPPLAAGLFTPTSLAASQQAWLNGSITAWSELAKQQASAMSTLMSHGLKPIHRRATANARRLWYA